MHRYVVKDNRELSPTTRLLTLRCLDDERPLLFEPGQYAAIGFKNRWRPTPVRCFSIASSPADQEHLQFSMRVKGRYTSAVRNLKAGDEVTIRGPFGGFVFKPARADSVVLLAGGIGIAPYMSMIRYATDQKLANKIHLIYSNQTQADVPFLDDLQKLSHQNHNLFITHIIGAGETSRLSGHKALVGRLDDSIIDTLNLDYQNQLFYLCGPPPYMKAVRKLLLKKGVPAGSIISEAFSQSSRHQTGAIRSWPFNIYALSAMAIIIGGVAIMATDLRKTIPKLETTPVTTESDTNQVIPLNGRDAQTAVNSLGPQVDTNIEQDAVVKTIPPSTKVTPTKTITPAPTPKTAVS